jgi:NAD(P)-dependent dehydrogenase (short-subunit alcohol dehydrogenase family)
MPLAVITGANVGLGLETARGLLGLGFEVVITSRDENRAEVALGLLSTEFSGAKLASLPLDLSKTSSLDSFADSFASRFGSWDILINNAGAKVLPRYLETDSGVEYHFGVNAVGHFAVTADLLPYRAEKARVISVASIVAKFAPQHLGPVGSSDFYSPGLSYAASKFSNLLFSLELHRRFGSESFSSLAAHPGFAKAEPYGPRSTRFFESFLAQSAKRGALPIIEAATNEALTGGSYVVPEILELWGKPKKSALFEACSDKNQEENWRILENLSGRKLVL